MELEQLFSPLEMSHEAATVETLLDMREYIDEFDRADLEMLFAVLEEMNNE